MYHENGTKAEYQPKSSDLFSCKHSRVEMPPEAYSLYTNVAL